MLNNFSHQQAGPAVKSQFNRNTNFDDGTLDIDIKDFLSQLNSVGKKMTGVKIGKTAAVILTKGTKIEVPVIEEPVVEEPKVEVKVEKKTPAKKSKAKKSKSVKKDDSAKETVWYRQ